MKSIYRGTTPLLKFEYPFEYQYVTYFTITFSQDGQVIFKIPMGDERIYTIEDRLVTVELSEEDTNKFKHIFPLDAQLKMKNLDGEIWAGDIKHYQVHRILDIDLFDR